ncbi:MAG: hypothetical protein JST22_03095 [Bacteroidetes bacterium]|nr:hypothetical protein [Bacteroidota bacterium]
MQSTTLDELGWLHDAEVFNITYDASRNNGRLLRIAMRCHDDAGYPPWNGKYLVLVAVDIVAVNHIAWAVKGPEVFDRAFPAISDELAERLDKISLQNNLVFSLYLHSGSTLEVVCRELQVEVAP